jgi:hypothetical protein
MSERSKLPSEATPLRRNLPEPLSLDNPPTPEELYHGPKHKDYDETCGFEIEEDFQRFNACNDTFARAQWDERVRSDKAIQWFKSMFTHGLGVREATGYQNKDFALRNAAWVGANLLIERRLKDDRHDGFLDDLTRMRRPPRRRPRWSRPRTWPRS